MQRSQLDGASSVPTKEASEMRGVTATAQVPMESASHRVAMSYRAFIKVGGTWANWVTSLALLAMISYTTTVNFYYLLKYNNVVTVTFPDLYAADKEWLFGADHAGPLNASLVYKFIESPYAVDVTNLKNGILGSPAAPFDATTPCIAVVGHDEGSVYGICEHFDPAQVPDWARSFDALVIQTIYIASVVKHRLGQKATAYVGFFQGFRNARNGWYQQETIDSLYCTTPSLSGVKADKPGRALFTKAHGLLRSVDCSSKEEVSSAGCQVIKDSENLSLFGDGTSMLPTYEVVRETNGKEWILGPWSDKWTIGSRSDAVSAWLLDDCLYVRAGSLGWFGAGYLKYDTRIPTLALLAKLQLIGFLLVVWLIKFRCVPYHAHLALFQTSRLGLVHLLVIQMLISAYYEQDILRTIYSWERHSVGDWNLVIYIVVSSALTCSLVALSFVRLVVGSSIFSWGCWLAITLPVPVMLIQIGIAKLCYSSYTLENGLMPTIKGCPPGVDSCGLGNTNYLCFVIFLAFLPVSVEYIRRKQWVKKHRPVQAAVLHADGSENVTERELLTSFERNCLDELPVYELVRDVEISHTWINGIAHVSSLDISACGFTIIKGRFLVRTKDLFLLLCATVLPRIILRDASVVVWPLVCHANGSMQVGPARRVLLYLIKYVQMDPTGPQLSLLKSEDHPLA